jgi:hypothetical protein
VLQSARNGGVGRVKVTIDMAINNAEASLKMEGLHPSPEVLSECRKVLSGEVSHEQYVAKLQKKYMEPEYGAL